MLKRVVFIFLSIAIVSVGMAYAGDQDSPTRTQISSKQNDEKAVAAMPDVCQTPPSTPATPPGVPVPYPNTGMASDTLKGTEKVKVSGKEVQLKNKSYFEKSRGDEPGTQPPNTRRSSDTPISTEKVEIKGREIGSKNKDYLNDGYDENPYP